MIAASAYNSLAMRLDPVQMARAIGIEPDEWQQRLLRSKALRSLVCCSRQVGKSTTVATLAVHTAFYEENSLILLLSPSMRQSQELFRKCLDVYRALGRPIAPTAENALSLELEQGSRIVSLPGNEAKIRGMSGVRLLIIDEASRVVDGLYKSVRPMLAVSGGKLVVLSSPAGTRGFFYEAYKNRHNWDYFEVPATACSRISAEFLAEEYENMGEYFYNQEYLCKFNDAEQSAFRSEDIASIVSREVQTWSL